MSREEDAEVAEKVFGLQINKLFTHDDYDPILVLAADNKPPAAYTTDPSADYEVLKHVRENWEDGPRLKFCDELNEIWASRALLSQWHNSWEQFYEPGDYAKAALKAIK